MPYSLTQLRANIYQVIDKVLETGIPAEIERKGKLLRIVPVKPTSRLSRLKPHKDYIRGNPEDLIHLDWSVEWKP